MVNEFLLELASCIHNGGSLLIFWVEVQFALC